jgi:hypothetical protein
MKWMRIIEDIASTGYFLWGIAIVLRDITLLPLVLLALSMPRRTIAIIRRKQAVEAIS